MRAPSTTKELVADGATCARLTAIKITSVPELVAMEDGGTTGTEWGMGEERHSSTLTYYGVKNLCQWIELTSFI